MRDQEVQVFLFILIKHENQIYVTKAKSTTRGAPLAVQLRFLMEEGTTFLTTFGIRTCYCNFMRTERCNILNKSLWEQFHAKC